MTDRSSSAYLASVLLHGGALAIILLMAYTFDSMRPESPKTFELVAGEGDNYAATAAPALGEPGGIKLSLPALPAPSEAAPPAPPAEPEPAAAAVTPAPPAPVKPAAVKPAAAKPAAKPASKIPNFTRSVERTAARVANRIEAKYKKELLAEKRRQMTQEEYLKEHPSGAASEGIRQGVVGGSAANKTGGAGGRALTREEGSELEAYWAMLKSRLVENLEKPTDASDTLTAVVEFYVAADGSLSQVRISRSSGNDEFDQAVLQAVRRTHSIGPRPDGRGDVVQVPFKMHEDDAAP
jgi:colicin import membrane protein